jgi:hypothetical protein
MQILQRRVINGVGGFKAQHFDIMMAPDEYPIPQEYITFVGIDPGTRNMGLALIQNGQGRAFDIHLPPCPTRIESIKLIQFSIQYLMENFWSDGFGKGCWILHIEDAAFGMKFGQVQLAESRCSAMMYFAPHAAINIIAPARIRKTVFGGGKIKAETVWDILPNAGAALSCAVYGMLTYD